MPSDPILAAQEAYRSRDSSALDRLAVQNPGHLLIDYIQFWSIEARLGQALHQVTPAEVHAFLQHPPGPLQERLREDWLKALAQQQDWVALRSDAAAYAGTDPDILCGLANARAAHGDPARPEEDRLLFLTGRSTPPGCEPVFARMFAARELTADDAETRFELALQLENVNLARALLSDLPPQDLLPSELFGRVLADPGGVLARDDLLARTSRSAQALRLHAVKLVARSDPERARALWERAARWLAPADLAAGWARIAVQAAQRLDPLALDDFRRARDSKFSDTDLAWWTRAALRAGAWTDVMRAVDAMGEPAASEPAWRFWHARALKALGRGDEAEAQLAAIPHGTDFYGQLAQEELGQRLQLAGTARAVPEEVATIRGRPGLQRAIALFRLGLHKEAVAEWGFALRGASDRQWLAAAELARQAEWYDRMISSAEHAGAASDPALRYPLAFRENLHARAQERGLDEAWVYGLVRQESRFLAEARSRVGATGLMQLMPATARWVAQRMGLHDYRPARVDEVDTNLLLGSYYLRHVLDGLGSPLLATAAYNAGPSRVRRWVDAIGLEGAIFCETIPLAETRDYVKKVMANANLYAQRLGQAPRSLKDRLGRIGGAGAVPPPDPADADGAIVSRPAPTSAPVRAGLPAAVALPAVPLRAVPGITAPGAAAQIPAAPVTAARVPVPAVPVPSVPAATLPVASVPVASVPVASVPATSFPAAPGSAALAPVASGAAAGLSSAAPPGAPVAVAPIPAAPVTATPGPAVPVASAPVSSTPVPAAPASGSDHPAVDPAADSVSLEP